MMVSMKGAHHVFATSHEALVDDLGRIVATGINVDAFFDDRIRAGTERLANLISAGLDLRLLLRLLLGSVRVHIVERRRFRAMKDGGRRNKGDEK